MYRNDRDWSATSHPFVPELIERIKRLRGMNRAWALMDLARAFDEEEEYRDAVTALDRARKIALTNQEWTLAATCDTFAASSLRDDALYLAAFHRALVARQAWLNLGDLHGTAESEVLTATCLCLMLRFDEANDRLDKAQAIFMEVGADDDARRCIRMRTEIAERRALRCAEADS